MYRLPAALLGRISLQIFRARLKSSVSWDSDLRGHGVALTTVRHLFPTFTAHRRRNTEADIPLP